MNPLLRILQRENSYYRNSPIRGSFDLTLRCNCRCLTCNTWRLGKQEEELTFQEIVSALDQMKSLGIREISLIGAEPFMRKDIVPIIRYIKTLRFKCTITTNATLITSNLAERICACGLDNIIVSIDKVGQGHDTMRSHKGAFNKAINAISYLKQARKRMAKNNPVISIHVTLSNINVDAIEEMWDLKQTLGVDILGYSYACQTKQEDFRNTIYKGRPIASSRFLLEKRTLNFSDADIANLKNHIKGMKQKNVALPFSLKSLTRWRYSNLIRNIVPIKKCYLIRNMVKIDSSGNVLPCSNLDGFAYGNIRRESLLSILQSSRRKHFLKRISANFFPVCKSCANFSLTPTQLISIFLGLSLKDKGNFK